MLKMTEKDILKILSEVRHPARGDRDIVDLGMVHGVETKGGGVTVTLGFPKRRDPLAEYLIGAARAALIRGGIKDPKVETVVLEDAAPKKKAPDFDTECLRNVRHIIGVAWRGQIHRGG